MKLIVALAFIILTGSSFAQINFRTGDATLEAELNVINTEANKDLSAFKTRVSSEYTVVVPKIDELLRIMKPAEIELSLRIGKILQISLETVTQTYQTNKDKGWGVIAKELGIKPGSPEFHALKGKPKKNQNHPTGNGNGHGKGNGKNK